MKPAIAKELRLLLPAYLAAMLLAVAPVWFFGRDSGNAPVALVPFGIGAVALALSSFGREFAMNTFGMMLSEPVERKRVWWTKVGLLAGGLLTVALAWVLSCAAWFKSGTTHGIPVEMLVTAGVIVGVAFAGGLWTTLVLQQVTAALWFTILVPAAITVIAANTVSDSVLATILGAYSLAGFLLAWWRFQHVEEIGWTGGVVSLPGWRSRAKLAATTRSRHPWAALAWKELQLQQVGLFGIAWLFLLHLGVVVLRKFGHFEINSSVHTALDVFGGIWLLVPLLISAVSTAEERKLGTLDGLLSLPISSTLQLALKLIFVLLLGALLPGLLFATAERVGGLLGAPSDIEFLREPFSKIVTTLTLPMLALVLIGFYASTLTRNVIQAMAAGLVLILAIWFALAWATISPSQSTFVLWQGPLPFYFGIPVLVLTLLGFAVRNFRAAAGASHIWLRNALGLLGAFVFIGVSTAVTFHRTWELLLPLEPAHGPAQLSQQDSPKLKSYVGGGPLVALLPDRRLWINHIVFDPGRSVLHFGEGDRHNEDFRSGFRVGGKFISLDATHLVPGSNWVDAVTTFRETVALRADGTLWVSEIPRKNSWSPGHSLPPLEEPAPLVQFGSETNWQSLGRSFWEGAVSFFLLKHDGTLWRWTGETNSTITRTNFGLRASEPHRLGQDTDWARFIATYPGLYAWKTDGRAFMIRLEHARDKLPTDVELEEGIVLERVPTQDNLHWRSLTESWPLHVAVRDDGTLWAWNVWPPPNANTSQRFLPGPPVQIGSDTDWRQVSGTWQVLVGLKTNGSVWRWREEPEYKARLSALTTERPTRLGSHNDSLAIGSLYGGIVSLSADGNLWYWWNRSEELWDSPQPMMMASRRPVRIGNVLR